MSEAEEISLKNYSSTLGFGVECEQSDVTAQIIDMFAVSFHFVSMIKIEGQIIEEKTQLTLSPCTKQDFFNEFNETFDSINLGQFYCSKEKNYTVQGIYSSDTFHYYEILVKARDNSLKTSKTIINYLTNGECHLTYYFIDVAINTNDYKHPIRRFINTNFLTLKPDEYVKMNLYFKIQEFNSYENYLFDKHKTQYYIGYSSLETYSTYKGINRFETKPADYTEFAKIYVRSALDRNIIQRKYMKLTEFAANMSSILSQILVFLMITVNYINRFFSHCCLMKKIYEFKESNNSRHRLLRFKYKEHFPKGEFKLGAFTNTFILLDKNFFQNLNENLNEWSIIQPINKNISDFNTCHLQNKIFSDFENAKSNSTSGRMANSSM